MADGTTSAGGDNWELQCGLSEPAPVTYDAIKTVPTRVDIPPLRTVATMAGRTCGVAVSGALWCWGKEDRDNVALYSEDQTPFLPRQIGLDTGWVDVAP